MLTVVVIINLSIALFVFYITWHLWRFRQILAGVADILFEVENCTDRSLQNTPPAILMGQMGSRKLRDRYHRLECYLLRLQKILALLNGGRRMWQHRISTRREVQRSIRRHQTHR